MDADIQSDTKTVREKIIKLEQKIAAGGHPAPFDCEAQGQVDGLKTGQTGQFVPSKDQLNLIKGAELNNLPSSHSPLDEEVKKGSLTAQKRCIPCDMKQQHDDPTNDARFSIMETSVLSKDFSVVRDEMQSISQQCNFSFENIPTQIFPGQVDNETCIAPVLEEAPVSERNKALPHQLAVPMDIKKEEFHSKMADLGISSIEAVLTTIEIKTQELAVLNTQLSGKSNRRTKKLERDLQELNQVRDKYFAWEKQNKQTTHIDEDTEFDAKALRKGILQLKKILEDEVDLETYEDMIRFYNDICIELTSFEFSQTKRMELESEIAIFKQHIAKNEEFVAEAFEYLSRLKATLCTDDSDGEETGNQLRELIEFCEKVLGNPLEPDPSPLLQTFPAQSPVPFESAVLPAGLILERNALQTSIMPPVPSPETSSLLPFPTNPHLFPASTPLPLLRNESLGLSPFCLTHQHQSHVHDHRPEDEIHATEECKNKQKEAFNLPDCAEKSVLALSNFLHCLCQDERWVTSELPRNVQFLEMFATLKTQLIGDEYLLHGIVKEKLQEVEALLQGETSISKIKQICCCLDDMLHQIRPLDMDLMLSCLKHTHQTSQEIAGKDIVLLLGDTGAGKSLTVHFLVGTQIAKEGHSLVPVEIKPGLEQFVTSDSSHSVTRSINSVSVELHSLLPQSSMSGYVTLCDTPGFGDTDGAEYDIANGIGIANAMRVCKSIKPVILISNLENRAKGVLQISKILVQIFSSIEQHLPSFTYIFTKFEKEKDTFILHTLKKVESELSAKLRADTSFVALLGDMIRQGCKHGIFILDPVHDTPSVLLEHILQKPAVVNPKDVVQDFVSQSSVELLTNQLLKDNNRLKFALDAVDVPLLSFKLNQLRQLNTCIDVQESKTAFESATAELKKTILVCMDRHESCISNILSDKTTDSNGETKLFRSNCVKLVKFEQLRFIDTVLSVELPILPEYVHMGVSKLASSLKKKVEGNFTLEMYAKQSFSEANMMLIVETISKLCFLHKEFSDSSCNATHNVLIQLSDAISIMYQETCLILESKLTSIFSEVESSCTQIKSRNSKIVLEQLANFVLYMDFIEQAKISSCIWSHVNSNAYSKHQADVNNFSKFLLETMSQACAHLGKMRETPMEFNSEDVSQILETLGFLSLVISYKNIGKYMDCATIIIQCRNLLTDASILIQESLQGLLQELHNAKGQSSDRLLEKAERTLSICRAFFQNSTLHENNKLYTQAEESADDLLITLHENNKKLYTQAEESVDDLLIMDERYLVQHLPFCNERLEPAEFSVRMNGFCQSWENLKRAATLFKPFPRINAAKRESSVKEQARLILERFQQWITENPIAITKQPVLHRVFGQMNWTVKTFDVIEVSFVEVQNIFLEQVQQKLLLIRDQLSSKSDVCTYYEQVHFGCVLLDCIERFNFGTLLDTVDSVQTLCSQVHEHFQATFLDEMQVAKLEECCGEDAASVVRKIYDNLNTLKFIKQLNVDDFVLFEDVVETVAGRILKDIFRTKATEILDVWCMKRGYLETYLQSLTKKTEIADKDASVLAMEELLVKCKCCFVLDLLMSCENQNHHVQNFKDLGRFLESRIQKIADGLISRLKISMLTNNFQEFSAFAHGHDFSEQSSTGLPQVLSDLEKCILKLLDEVNQTVNSLSKSSQALDALKQTLPKIHSLNEAENHALSFLSEGVRCNLLAKITTSKQNVLRVVVEFLNVINQDVESNNFSKAEEKICAIESLAEQAGEISVHQLTCDAPTPCLKKIILDGVQTRKDSIKTKVKSTIEKYRILPVEDYSSDPPSNCFGGFRDAFSSDIMYRHAYNEMAEVLACVVKQYLMNDSSSAEECSPDMVETRVATVESLAKYIPPDVVGKYEETLHITKHTIIEAKEATKRQHEMLAAAGKLGTLTSFLEQYSDKKELGAIESCKHNIQQNILSSCKKFEADLGKGDLAIVLRALPSCWNDWLAYFAQLNRIRQKKWPTPSNHRTDTQHGKSAATKHGHYSSHSPSKPSTNYSPLVAVEATWVATKDFFVGIYSNMVGSGPSDYGGYKNKTARNFWASHDLEKLFSDIQCFQACDNVLTQVTRDVNTSLLTVFRLPEDNLETMKSLAREFPKIIALVESVVEDNLFLELHNKAPETKTQLIKTIKHVAGCFLAHQRLFETALDTKNLNLVSQIMDATQDLEALNLYSSVEAFADMRWAKENTPVFEDIPQKCFSYKKMKSQLGTHVFEWKSMVTKHFQEDDPRTSRELATERDDFYIELSQSFHQLMHLRKLPSHVDAAVVNLSKIEEECRTHFRNQIAGLEKTMESLLDQIPATMPSVYQQYNIWHGNLRSIADKFDDATVAGAATTAKDRIDRQFKKKLFQMQDEISQEVRNGLNEDQLLTFVVKLMDVKSISNQIPNYKKDISSVIDEIMNEVKTLENGLIVICKINSILRKHKNTVVSQALISDTYVLQGYALELRNEKTLRFTVDHVLGLTKESKKCLLKGDPDDVNPDMLKYNHEMFDKEYWLLVDKGLVPAETENVLKDIVGKARRLSRECNTENYQLTARNLMACVFAFWTLDHYQKAAIKSQTSESKTYLLQPHAAQVIAIFRLLKIENRENTPTPTVSKSKQDLPLDGDDLAPQSKAETGVSPPQNSSFFQMSECSYTQSESGRASTQPMSHLESPECNYPQPKYLSIAQGIDDDSNVPLAGNANINVSLCCNSSWSLSEVVETLECTPMPPPKSVITSRENSFTALPSTSSIPVLSENSSDDYPKQQEPTNFVSLPNHLVEIFTGEGKSITLAVTAAVLALLGFDVACACYSEYLSKRDYDSFQPLFKKFRIDEYISYGTFNRLCEEFINSRGDVRNIVESTIFGNQTTSKIKNPSTRPAALLIDEVDVFFNKDFYGNIYRPLVSLKHSKITALIKHIWHARDKPEEFFFREIQSCSLYVSCLELFSEWEELFEECIKTLLIDLDDYNSQEYVVEHDKIGYKDQDAISYNISFGYKTLFAYFKEWEAGNITPSTLESKIALLVSCGNFSYAEIPTCYAFMMGVTGTLSTLSSPEKNLLENAYNIRRKTFIPSVYGENFLFFSPDSQEDCLIDDEANFHTNLMREIDHRLKSTQQTNYARSVLVFFETTKKLKDFLNSPAMIRTKSEGKVRILTENTLPVDREGIIAYAVNSGSITLLGREFGRGTDFICYDERLIDCGGIHVIQTFVSEAVSEETQIKGRTARQGNRGSFSMVLVNRDLEKYGISLDDIHRMKSVKQLYSEINQKRCCYFEKTYPESMRYVQEIQNDHRDSTNFVKCLIEGDTNAVKEFLIKHNKAPKGGICRTLILMDATGSMSSSLTKAKNTVKTMFSRMHHVIESRGDYATLEIQYACYRNYSNTPDMLLQFSPWETNPDNLRKFLDSISVSGGLGHEAIEVGLAHAIAEDDVRPIHQVVLIGDAAPNTREEVSSHRATFHSNLWAKTKFCQPTFYANQVCVLKQRKIPVHAFYVEPQEGCAASFLEISRMAGPGGRSEELDINSDKGHEQLINVIAEEVLRKYGGDALVDDYKRMFPKGYCS